MTLIEKQKILRNKNTKPRCMVYYTYQPRFVNSYNLLGNLNNIMEYNIEGYQRQGDHLRRIDDYLILGINHKLAMVTKRVNDYLFTYGNKETPFKHLKELPPFKKILKHHEFFDNHLDIMRNHIKSKSTPDYTNKLDYVKEYVYPLHIGEYTGDIKIMRRGKDYTMIVKYKKLLYIIEHYKKDGTLYTYISDIHRFTGDTHNLYQPNAYTQLKDIPITKLSEAINVEIKRYKEGKPLTKKNCINLGNDVYLTKNKCDTYFMMKAEQSGETAGSWGYVYGPYLTELISELYDRYSK